MKTLSKHFLIALTQVMLIFSFVLGPIPLTPGSVYTVYAQDSDPCAENETEDGVPGVYKPGCDFNDALVKVTEEKYSNGVVGIIEQFIGAAFALAATSSLVFHTTPRSAVDCPQNQNAQATLRIMQIGSLAYLLGEIQAKIKFKKAAKEAADANFAIKLKANENVEDEEAAEKARQENSDQMKAYNALVKVYEAKVKALQGKRTLSIAAEVAYLAALGAEIGLTMSHKAVCESSRTAFFTSKQTSLAALHTFIATATGSAVCADVGGVLQTFATQEITCKTTNATNVATEVAEKEVVDKKEAGKIAGIFNGLISAFKLGLTQFMSANPFSDVDIEVGKDAAKAATNQSVRGSCLSSATASATGIQAACAAQAAKTVVAPACVSLCQSGFGLATSIQTADTSAAILCCGSNAGVKPADGDYSIPFPSIMDKKVDILIAPLYAVVKGKTNDFHKAIVLNTLHRTYHAMVESNQTWSPKEKIAKLAALNEMSNHVEENFDDLIKNHPEYDKIMDSLNSQDDLQGMLAKSFQKFQKSLVQDANASFGDLLGFGMKLFAMQMFLGKHFRGTFLPKPRNRMYTFGTMAAINAALVVFNGKAIKDAEERLAIVRRERQAFADSHALGSQVEMGEVDGPRELEVRDRERSDLPGQGIVGCADPKGNGFVPAVCPSNIRRGNLNIPFNPKTARLFNNTPLGDALPLLSDVAYTSASGKGLSSDDLAGGKLGKLEKNRNALKKFTDKLIKDYDAENIGKSKDPKLKKQSLGNFMSQQRGVFKGTPINSSQAAAAANELASIKVPDVKALQQPAGKGEGAVAKFNPPKFETPKGGGGGDFNFDLGGGGDSIDIAEDANTNLESLDNFQVNAGDINENEGVSIFKVISNRYIQSYPTLLDEKK